MNIDHQTIAQLKAAISSFTATRGTVSEIEHISTNCWGSSCSGNCYGDCAGDCKGSCGNGRYSR